MSHADGCPEGGAELGSREDGLCPSCLLTLGLGPAEAPPDRPRRIGGYRILDVLGEGGFGIVYLAEQAPPGRRGFYSSWAAFGATGGILLGSAVGAALSSTLTDEQLTSWGWRAAFLGGISVAALGLLLRRGGGTEEPPAPPSARARSLWG